MKFKVVLLSVSIIFLIVMMCGCTDENSGNDEENHEPNSDGSSWLDNYEPKHSIGTGIDDFWVAYPTNNPKSGQSVPHLSWVNDSLENGCTLFVVHRTGCVACQAQADRVINLAEKYEDHVVFHDLDATLGGSVEQKAYDAYVYDPDGSPGYIALTGVFTLIENNGDIEYIWHSWERDVDDAEMEEWVKDGIYYYYLNSEG